MLPISRAVLTNFCFTGLRSGQYNVACPWRSPVLPNTLLRLGNFFPSEKGMLGGRSEI